MGKRRRQAKQASMWVATNDLPRSAAHPFYTRLNQIPDQQGFDGYVDELCQRFHADEIRPALPPERYFRLLLIGCLESLDAERPIRLHCASFSAWCRRTRGRPTRRYSHARAMVVCFKALSPKP